MRETAIFRVFVKQPMGNKSIADVPGVGPIAAKKLKSMNFTKASDLYNKLKQLNFDERRFRVWLRINCKGARVTHIYNAFVKWHSQFGDQDDYNYDESEDEGEATCGSRPAPARKPRNTVQFDLPASHRDSINSNNPLTLFFASFADSCKNISPEYHTALKMEILSVVSKYETQSRESRSGTSTSNAANGV